MPKKKLPDYENQDGRGASRSAQLTDALSKWICALVAQGWSFNRILNHPEPFPGLPSKLETILNWLTYGEQRIHRHGDKASVYAVFADRYLRATQVQALAGYDQTLDIEARVLNEPKYLPNPDYDKAGALDALRQGKDYPEPKYLHNPRYLDVATASCVLSSIHWRLARLAPEKFGDKLEVYRHISVEHKLSEDAPDWLRQQVQGAVIDHVPTLPKPKAGKKQGSEA